MVGHPLQLDSSSLKATHLISWKVQLQTNVLCLSSDAFFMPLTKDHLPDLALSQQNISNSLERQSWA